MSNVTKDQIREMAKLTMLSNRLNEIQTKNLQMYPYVFFNNVTKAVITFDLECQPDSIDTKETFVQYEISTNGEEIDNLDKRLDAIQKSVRQLFWGNVKVLVSLDGKMVLGAKDERK